MDNNHNGEIFTFYWSDYKLSDKHNHMEVPLLYFVVRGFVILSFKEVKRVRSGQTVSIRKFLIFTRSRRVSDERLVLLKLKSVSEVIL